MATRRPLPIPLRVGAEIVYALNPNAPGFIRNRFATRGRVIAAGGTWARDRALFERVWSEVAANRNPALDDVPYYRVPARKLYDPWVARGDLWVMKLAFVQRNVDPQTLEPISDVYTHEHEYTSSKPVTVRAAASEWISRIENATPTEGGSRWQILAVFPRKLLWPTRSRDAAAAFRKRHPR